MRIDADGLVEATSAVAHMTATENTCNVLRIGPCAAPVHQQNSEQAASRRTPALAHPVKSDLQNRVDMTGLEWHRVQQPVLDEPVEHITQGGHVGIGA